MKKRIILLFYILAFSLFVFGNKNVFALEGATDTFELLEKAYEADEKFVFTATANFKSGQAAGLVFGAKENEYYYVLNIDRFENKVKVLYFSAKVVGEGYDVEELYTDWYIGNDKMTEGEKNKVNPKVRDVPEVYLKVIITPEADGVHAEFFVDGIKRFGIDNDIILDEKYVGGYLGYNVFNANVDFTDVEIGASDYSYYTEMYRQQYHFSQYKNWNNDPNGLVYYNGYYHLYFQHHPYSKYWNDMYWGHARSKDLVHWEQLPICVFPDDLGYAWSGSARVYHKGEIPEIDSWFTKDTGLIAFYTSDGERQDQVIMSSDDEGMTWTKRRVVPQGLVGIHDRKVSCRDPKVFEVQNGNEKVYGMVISGMETNDVWLLQSRNMLDWEYAGHFNMFRPECVDVVEIVADDNTTHTVLTFEGREYLVGEFKYNNDNRTIYFEKYSANGGIDITNKTIEEINAPQMDFGPDSYATQSFYIDDTASKYFGKTISLSWFSGVPGAEPSAESGAFAAVRTKWNGGGFTIPVELGLKKVGDEYVLTQTPITLENSDFDKEEIVSVSNDACDTNLLKDVNTHQLEIIAEFNNPNKEDIEFKINIGEDEYTAIGWNAIDGYYVDRRNTSDGGINFPNYHRLYTSGAVDTDKPTFYILSDNGGVEVFCEDFTIPFYVLTLPSVYSTKAELNVGDNVTVNNLEVNKIKSVFYDEDLVTDEGVVYISQSNVRLDLNLTNKTNVLFYTTSNNTPSWEIISGNDVVEYVQTTEGIEIEAKAIGEAVIQVTCGNVVKEVHVKVETGKSISDIEFTREGVIGGKWYQTANGLVGNQIAGDGFLLSNEFVQDCYYTAQFDLGTGAAAALVLRASKDMKDYIIVNFDKNGQIVKAWTPNGELVNKHVGNIDTSHITLSAILKGNQGTIILNGFEVASFTLRENDSKEGYLGLNVCATEATFKAVTLQKTAYTYNGGNLTIQGNVSQAINKINNMTLTNQKIDHEFITVDGRNVTISEEYFKTLKSTGVYQLEIVGYATSFVVNVDVKTLPHVEFSDVELSVGENLNIYLGNLSVNKVVLNNVELTSNQYTINNFVLKIDASLLVVGTNTLIINEEEITIEVSELENIEIIEKPTTPDKEDPIVKPQEPSEEQGGCKGFAGMSLPVICFIFLVMIFARAFVIHKKRVL